ncbi:MAG: HIT family protein [Candidatus Pacearchaeota archaeon]|nr:HIT family protein [Candidatus Pacearchaeota archaeon]
MENCIFCKIAKGEIPSVKIWEDEKHLAILDINPNTEGMTLVLTKEHYDSDATEMPDKPYKELMIAAKKVAKILKKKLKVKMVGFVIEGLGVNHVHIKLYPLYKLDEGYITTQLGPQKSTEELNKIADRIRG